MAWTSATIHGLVHASVLMLGDLHQRTHRVSLLQVLAVANAIWGTDWRRSRRAFLADRFGADRSRQAS